MSANRVRVYNVEKRYGMDRCALRNVNFELESGEFAFFTGVSGAGKTTLLKLLFGMEKPTQGKIFVDQAEVSTLGRRQLSGYRQRVGFVFQDFKLISDLTIQENISLPLDVRKMKPHEIKHRVDGVLSLVGLQGRENCYPDTLSGGEQQRVAIARSVVGQPTLLLADEPTGNLDSQNARDIMALFQEISSLGTTVCVATHDEFLMSEFPARVIELKNGTIEADLPVEN